MLEKLRQEFLEPSNEFTPIPFWFWNDTLSETEILRQIQDFKAKGVMGFVIHPRIGLPIETEYLSDDFMHYVKYAVEEAAKSNMKVVLYDEAMYPSGSAHGMVVQSNPEYAAHGLKMLEFACKLEDEYIPNIMEDERVISVIAVEKITDNTINPQKITALEFVNGKAFFQAPAAGAWSVLFFVQTKSKGTIRGIHFGEDDNEPNAPLAGDLLNPDAMDKFIELTYDRYYSILGQYFGNTVTSMFTDEPDMLGRCSERMLKPWTIGFMEWYKGLGGNEFELPLLWFDGGKDTETIRKKFRLAVSKRLEYSYYSRISKWCKNHNIKLTGHPHESDDIGLLEHFHIPGQDIVWRWVAPEDNKGVEGIHSTMGKCSSDSARHRGKQRNSNECFGCCGPDGMHWAFSADDMKWYLDWLFVRGVNLIYPHAYYYSIREERVNERPPDVGPNNLWWPYYRMISDYIKRMGWLMTDSRNLADVAVLCEADHLPWQVVKSLYQNQIEFNYLEESLLFSDMCTIQEGKLCIAQQNYRILLVEDPSILTAALCGKLKKFIDQGGIVTVFNPDSYPIPLIGYQSLWNLNSAAQFIKSHRVNSISFNPSNVDLRISHVVKEGVHFYLLVNEGEGEIKGELAFALQGQVEVWDAWKGEGSGATVEKSEDGVSHVQLLLKRRETLILCVDTSKVQEQPVYIHKKENQTQLFELSNLWRIYSDDGDIYSKSALESWTNWKNMDCFSGTVNYETEFELEKINASKIVVDLGSVFEIAHLFVNGQDVGVKMWAPYEFDITPFVNTGRNSVNIKVTNNIANRMLDAKLSSGLLGPVRIILNN